MAKRPKADAPYIKVEAPEELDDAAIEALAHLLLTLLDNGTLDRLDQAEAGPVEGRQRPTRQRTGRGRPQG